MKVPITYSAKDKMLARIQQDPNIDRPTATIPLPLMTFELTSTTYDGDRKLPTINRSATKNANNSNIVNYQYNPVPYNFGFRLNILVKNAEDGTKIVEQILPFFTPDFTVTVQLIPQMNELKDIPVILNSISHEDTYSGDLKERQTLTWTLDFTLKGYLYGPIKTSKIIKYANVYFYTPSVPDGQLVAAVGNTANVSYIHIQPGLTANGMPTSNAALSIPVADINITDDFGYVIEKVDAPE
jgi:hypothetical protein